MAFPLRTDSCSLLRVRSDRVAAGNDACPRARAPGGVLVAIPPEVAPDAATLRVFHYCDASDPIGDALTRR